MTDGHRPARLDRLYRDLPGETHSCNPIASDNEPQRIASSEALNLNVQQRLTG